MKNILVLLFLSFLATTNAFCISQAPAKKPVRVFITAGQSNTDGRVSNKLLPQYIKAMATDTTDFLKGQYQYCKISQNSGDGTFAPYWPKGRITEGRWTYDAITYYLIEKAIQEDFYVVKWAVGGTSIGYPADSIKGRYWSANPEWLQNTTSTLNKGKSLLLSFTESIDKCIDETLSKIDGGYQVDAFLWHQGESDDKFAGDYYQNLKAVIQYVRSHLTNKTGKDYTKLPFIFGSIPEANRHYRPQVEAAMQRIANEDPNAYLIDMSKQELQRDRTHFNEKSAEYLGVQMYRTLEKILDLSDTGFRIANYKDDKAGAISYTFDDGLREHYTLVAPQLEKYGFRGTFWINGAVVNENEKALADTTRVSWANLKEMADAGHEISNHSWSHPNMKRLSLEEISIEIERNDSAIFACTGILPRTFCYPYNARNDTVLAMASANRVDTRTRQFSVGGKSTSENLEKKVNELIKKKEWGITMTHGITYGYDKFTDPQIYWDHLRKVKVREDSIWVGTFREVAAYINERKAVTYDIVPTKTGCKVTPYITLNQEIFTEPLTAVIERPDVRKISVRQQGKKLKTRILSGKILFDFDPFGGVIDIVFK